MKAKPIKSISGLLVKTKPAKSLPGLLVKAKLAKSLPGLASFPLSEISDEKDGADAKHAGPGCSKQLCTHMHAEHTLKPPCMHACVQHIRAWPPCMGGISCGCGTAERGVFSVWSERKMGGNGVMRAVFFVWSERKIGGHGGVREVFFVWPAREVG